MEKIIKRRTINEEIMMLQDGEMIPLIRDFFGRKYFNDYRHKERATFLASVILKKSYKELEGKVECKCQY